MKKRAASLFLALALCLGLAVPALADGEALDIVPFLRVTGADGKIENCDLVEDGAGNGWTWTSATHTMTLNNFNGGDIYFDGYYGEDLKVTICQSGVNTVDGTIGFLKVHGIFDFTGEGSLTVTGELREVDAITLWSGKLLVAEKENDYKGIYCPVTVNGGELENRAERPSTALTLNGGLVKFAHSYGVDEEAPPVFNGGSFSVDEVIYDESFIGEYSVTMADGTPGDDVSPMDRLYPVVFTSTASPTQLEQSAQPEQTAPPVELTAIPTTSDVAVDHGVIEIDAYNIGGANYFKLRDLAVVLRTTEKKFGVDWDAAANAISLTSGARYYSVGGEMTPGTGTAQTAAPTSSKILLNGAEVSLEAYNIGGNNYFKLRDIGSAFDFGVDWDGAANTVIIDTAKGYTP